MTDKPNFSRRDFLKFGAYGVGAWALKDQFLRLKKASIEIEQEGSFETDDAYYIPFFENHTLRNTDTRIRNTKPDYLFIEFVQKSNIMLNRSPLDILTAESEVSQDSLLVNRPPVDTGRFLSHELLLGLDDGNASISVEGINLPEQLIKQADVVKMATNVGSGSATVASLGIAIGRLIKTGEFSKGDLTRIYASTLASLWASSDELSTIGVALNFNTTEDSAKIRDAQNLANRLNAVVTFTHPEDIIVFMRNIFMSLKLLTLSEQKEESGSKKMKIAFRVGAAHGAISDMVKLGKDITMTLLDVYSNDILKQVIEDNTCVDKPLEERIVDFCKTIVIPVREARAFNSGTKYLVDTKLKDYLNKRFLETKTNVLQHSTGGDGGN